MGARNEQFVIVNDVGPRDGLQNQPKILTPAERLQLIQALLAAGLKSIEFGAFVSPKAVPAMAGADEIARQLPMDDAIFAALIPNRRGYDLAKDAGVHHMGLVVAASNTMNEKNIRMTTEQAVEVSAEVLAQARKDGLNVQVCIATAWECPFEGAVDSGVVSDLAARLMDLGASGLIIADTIGAANPARVNSLMTRLASEVGADKLTCHFHDTRAMALANVYGALEAGIRSFDASVGGLGGCPFAPGATGNVATEDLVMMLQLMGFETGIDLEKLLDAARLAGELIEGPTGGKSVPWLEKNLHRFA